MKKQVEYLQKLFYDLWNDFGSVYLLVKHSDRTSIGKRGFTEEEKRRGLVLVFNNKTNNTLNWDAEGNMTCILAFGARKEDIFIHHDDLLGVFSADAGVQFLRNDIGRETAAAPETGAPSATEPVPGHQRSKQVVSIENFRKRKPHDKK